MFWIWYQIGPKWAWLTPYNIQTAAFNGLCIRYLLLNKMAMLLQKMIFTLCVSFSFYRLISSSVCGRFEKYYSCHRPRGHFFLQRSKLGTFQGKFNEKWYFVAKIVLTYCERKMFQWSRKTFETWGSRPRISKFLRSLEQFIQTVKGQNNFWQQNVF